MLSFFVKFYCFPFIPLHIKNGYIFTEKNIKYVLPMDAAILLR